jgi:hypothetical protein
MMRDEMTFGLRIVLRTLVTVAAFAVLPPACSQRSSTEGKASKASTAVSTVGTPIAAMGEIHQLAADKDTVFVLIPEQTPSGIRDDIAQALEATKRKLESEGVSVALFTLTFDSREYSGVAAKQPVPAVIVMSKDRGQQTVSREITEPKLYQAYSVSAREGSSDCDCKSGNRHNH